MEYQITALAILLAFYSCYFGKMLLQKHQGIRTDQLGRGKTGLVKGIELTMKTVTVLVPVGEIVSILLSITSLHPALRLAGAGLGLLGVAVFVRAVLDMGDSWRAGVSEEENTALVTKGIYHFSRNPAFLGFDLVYLGIVLMFFSPWLLALSALGMLLFHLQIVNVEEDHLTAAYGEAYLEYCRQANRYFGRK